MSHYVHEQRKRGRERVMEVGDTILLLTTIKAVFKIYYKSLAALNAEIF